MTVCWLFYVYMKLGSKMWVCPRVNQAMLRGSWLLVIRCTMLHFILLLLGNGSRRRNGCSISYLRGSANRRRLSPCLQPFKSRLWASRGLGHGPTVSTNPRLFSLWVQTSAKYRFSCIVTKKPLHAALPVVFIYFDKYFRDLYLIFCPGTWTKYENVECMKLCPKKVPCCSFVWLPSKW